MNYVEAFATLAALVAATPVVTQAIRKLLKIEGGVWAQVLSWVVGLVLCMFGWVFDLGFLADITWWQALIYGIAASLAANGVFDIPFVQWILDLIFGKIGNSSTRYRKTF